MKKIVVMSALVLLLGACQQNQHRVTLRGVTFQVELAADDHARAKGLMYRKEMAADAGMLFVFPEAQIRSFWMKNTLIPLDILYFDHRKKIVSISKNTPPCRNTTTRCVNYPSKKPAQYVLEINAGLSDKYGFNTGDELFIELKK